MQNEAVLKQIADITQFVRDKADEIQKSGENREAELRGEMKKMESVVTDVQEQLKKVSKPSLPVPVSDTDARMFERGIFNGRYKANYARMLGVSPEHPYIRSTQEAESLKKLQDLHDATCFRYHALAARTDATMAIEALSKHPDTRAWAQELYRHGYIKDVDALLNPKSGQLMEVAMTRNNEMLITQNTTQGFNNLTFTLTSAQLIDQVYVDLVIANNVTRIPLSRASMKFPKLTGLTQGVWGGTTATGGGYIEIPSQGAANQTPPSTLMPDATFFQKPTIGSIQFDAEHILSFLLFNDDMLEDSIIPWLPFCRTELSKNIARAIDDATLNGDDETDTATNMDGYTDTNHARLAWNGIRYLTVGHEGKEGAGGTYTGTSSVAGGSAVLSLTMIETAIKQLGKYALQPSSCVICVSVSDYLKLVQDSTFKTWSNAGGTMTLRSGVLGQIYGMDVIASDLVPQTLDAYGVGTGGGQSCAFVWRRDQFLLGMFDTVQVESTRWAPRLFTILQADVRADFKSVAGNRFTSRTPGAWPAVCIYDVDV